MFLYIDPLKQGLKPAQSFVSPTYVSRVFIHRSIKTRIETLASICTSNSSIEFLYIDPLKQGLKRPHS